MHHTKSHLKRYEDREENYHHQNDYSRYAYNPSPPPLFHLSDSKSSYSGPAATSHHQPSTSSRAPREEDYGEPYLYDAYDSESVLKSKWLDNSPRMSRLREHRQKRLINKLEQFELWDIEQEQKQKQYEIAREQRLRNIKERLKSQEFCISMMRRRHESDLETSRELELYSNDHLYVDALDDPRTNYKGPVSQYRKFQAEMDDKMKRLETDILSVNPRHHIEQSIKPRLQRTRERCGSQGPQDPLLQRLDQRRSMQRKY